MQGDVYCVESLMPKGVEHKLVLVIPFRSGISVESLMPKGVEHLEIVLVHKRNQSVESLMPKGVEHDFLYPAINEEDSCRISDAERR